MRVPIKSTGLAGLLLKPSNPTLPPSISQAPVRQLAGGSTFLPSAPYSYAASSPRSQPIPTVCYLSSFIAALQALRAPLLRLCCPVPLARSSDGRGRHDIFIGCTMGSTRRRLSIQGSLNTGLVPRHDGSLMSVYVDLRLLAARVDVKNQALKK